MQAATTAKSKLAPARVGYGTTRIDLNVNRDLFNSKLEWRQEPNPNGLSDKTLAVVEFLGADNVPIAVYMNYAMHPINFYLSGVVSADFPGEASRYIEELFDDRTIAHVQRKARPAIRTRATSGRRPRSWASAPRLRGTRTVRADGRDAARCSANASAQGFNAQQASSERQAIPAASLDAYKKTIARTGEYVHMLGTMIGSSAVRVMRESIQPIDTARIWSGQETLQLPWSGAQ